MRGIKTHQYDFALKMQGGLMREGGRICGTLRYIYMRKDIRVSPFYCTASDGKLGGT